ncbi:MAG: 30S ribosomal protein S14 [Gemmataceae bacterium]
MSTKAKMAKYKKQMASLSAHKAEMAKPEGQRDESKLLRPRDLIRIRQRCQITGRPRANFRKFGVCRIVFRDMASSGLIPGVRKASW